MSRVAPEAYRVEPELLECARMRLVDRRAIACHAVAQQTAGQVEVNQVDPVAGNRGRKFCSEKRHVD